MKLLTYPPASPTAAFGAALLLSTALALAPLHPARAQVPGLKGVDHMGINVPNLTQAVQFFTMVLGFAPVTQIGPVPLEAAWQKPNRLHAGTSAVTSKMLRAGTGASIELFEYQASGGSRQPPGGDDLGATHISFYTLDMPASVAYLRAKGVKLLSEPVVTKAGIRGARPECISKRRGALKWS